MANRKGNRLVPAKNGKPALRPEAETKQAALRAAVVESIDEKDVGEVVQQIVKRAKEGDRVALKYFFDYILGGQLKTAVQQNIYVDATREPVDAVESLPGSDERIEHLARRAQNGERLFSTRDRVPDLS